ncbi:unnamed protein product [Tilletia controversa]|uniref:Arrestin-like N-terminal domain-containing protein n=3 Tax=Tilletia TaxID=13289 RepID=A0A8X7MQ93_9BASI|nr:hypothetical protein CF336_g4694 [Tilletia laevis]KAE8192660.1 hypothetical protein CF328_g5291 [Tilletia controversa]KAE8249270.1 hypothetical protein A4X03_0g6636 [Tilletia caries]KAE8196008.1 hypothetical protein CF335_g4959 [Tilletia laevis]KAE8245600.1 hypothetical protein A4X06_0g5556 [Tilletia controversa]
MPSRLSLTGTADLPDTVSQFINQRRFLARNSSSDASATGTPQTSGKGLDSSSAAPFSASIELDNARVYFPGQLFKVKIHVAPKNDASQVEEIAVEIKAWTHSYGWASNGSSSYPVFEKFVHYSVELPPGPQDGNSATNAGTGLDISKSDEQPNTWLISTRLPSTVINKTGWRSTGETTSIPPTFKDVKSSLSNTVYWIIKLTAKRSGVFKRNFRIWKPFIVLPLSPRAPPASNLPMLVISPEGLPPTPQSIRSALPDSWSTFSLESKLNSKKESDLLPSGSVRLPDLPLSGSSADDSFEHAILASVKGSDADKSKSKGKGKEDAHQEFQPSFEIIRHTRSRGHGSYYSARHRIPAFVQWDSPDFLSSNPTAGEAVDHGHAWTDPMPTQRAGLINAVDLPYTRSALLTGRLMVNVPPPIDSHNLRMKYKLNFHWAQPGLGNTISAALGRWIASTGVSRATLDTMGERLPDEEMAPEQVQAWRDLDRRVLGPRYILLRDPKADYSADFGDDDEQDNKNYKFDDDNDDGSDAKSGFFSRFMPQRSAKGDGKSSAADGDGSDSDDSDDVANLKAKLAIKDQQEAADKT